MAAIATHRQVLDDLDDARLEQARPGLAQRTLRRSADEPLQLVAERVAEMLCERNTPSSRQINPLLRQLSKKNLRKIVILPIGRTV